MEGLGITILMVLVMVACLAGAVGIIAWAIRWGLNQHLDEGKKD